MKEAHAISKENWAFELWDNRHHPHHLFGIPTRGIRSTLQHGTSQWIFRELTGY